MILSGQENSPIHILTWERQICNRLFDCEQSMWDRGTFALSQLSDNWDKANVPLSHSHLCKYIAFCADFVEGKTYYTV